MVFHTDHGDQHSAEAFRDACAELGLAQSMGTVGDSFDNAMAESFFASLKRELVDHGLFAIRADARAPVFEWLVWYNADRLTAPSSTGRRSSTKSTSPTPLHQTA